MGKEIEMDHWKQLQKSAQMKNLISENIMKKPNGLRIIF
jgi:hypothetical protein